MPHDTLELSPVRSTWAEKGRAVRKVAAIERSLCSARNLLGHRHQLAEGVAHRMGHLLTEAMRSRPD